LFGLASALTYGSADFFGGLASRRASILWVLLVSQATGLALFAATFPLLNDAAPSGRGIGWGAAAGVFGITGVGFLFRGLATGKMSLVAPVTGVLAAVIPVAFGLAAGERPAPVGLAGVLLALGAVALVSLAPDPSSGAARTGRLGPGIADALIAGTGFGLFFIALDAAGDRSGMWPLLSGRVVTFGVMVCLALARRRSLRRDRRALAPAAGSGVLDITANTFYLLGTRRGLLSIVAVLTSLYPAATVLLARAVLAERLARPQLAGLACAAGGVVLIALG
jgi:drug/metabolite transporter (DMT)-like permease